MTTAAYVAPTWTLFSTPNPGTSPSSFLLHPTSLCASQTFIFSFPPVIPFLKDGKDVSQIWCSYRELNGSMIMIIITEMMMKDVLLWVTLWCQGKTMKAEVQRGSCARPDLWSKRTKLRAAGMKQGSRDHCEGLSGGYQRERSVPVL